MPIPVIRSGLVPAAKQFIGHVVEVHGHFGALLRAGSREELDCFVSEIEYNPWTKTTFDSNDKEKCVKIATDEFVEAYGVGIEPRVGGPAYLGFVQLTGTIVVDPAWPSGVAIDKLTRAIIHVHRETHDLTPLLDPIERKRVHDEYHRKHSGNR